MRYFFLFLIIFPLIEIYTLIVIGGSIGAFTTMLWIFFSGIMGLYLLRNQGLKKLLDIQSKKSVFEPTADNFLKTIFTPIGGFFLVIPGFITDVIGILVLLPVTRIFILGLLFSYLRPIGQGNGTNKNNGDWIEGEYRKDK
ncbi:FxsA family protein [SAR86 cluster bacterium]|nr:FxsA family protein [SAR86 cluster bacterium]